MNQFASERLRPHPSVRFADNEQVFDLNEEVRALMREEGAGRHGQREKALFRHGPMTVGLFCLDEGAHIPDHLLDGDVIVHVIEGEVTIATKDREHRLPAGGMMVLAPRVRHDITAARTSRLMMIFCLEHQA